MLNKLLDKIVIKESDILNMFKDIKTLKAREIISNIIDSKTSILIEILSYTLDTDKEDIGINRIALLTHERLNNLVHKNYLTSLRDNSNEYSFSTLNIFDLGVKINKESIIRADYDKTKLYYNNSEETKIVELRIKTKASLHKTDFINVEFLNFDIIQNKKYKEYNIICICKPFTYIEVLTDKFDKSLKNISIDNPLKSLYKYYSMKVFIDDNKLIKLDRKNKKGLLELTVLNTYLYPTHISIFLNEVEKKNLIYYKCRLTEFTNTGLGNIVVDEDDEIYVYFLEHNKCIIYDSSENVLYHPKASS